MKRSRLFALVSVLGLLLAAWAVGSGLAQSAQTGAEPNAPLRPADAQAPQGSSQPAGPAGSWEEPMELTEAQRNSSAPILPEGTGSEPSAWPEETSPEGIDATAAIASLRITGTALKPRNSNATYVPTAGGGCFYSTAYPYTVFNTGVFLPQGAWVNTMRMYYNDTSADDSTAWFSVYDLYGNIVQEWGVSSSGASGNGFSDTALISHTIDYTSYSYAINWRPYVLGATMQNCGFRFFYEPPPYVGALLPAVWRSYP